MRRGSSGYQFVVIPDLPSDRANCVQQVRTAYALAKLAPVLLVGKRTSRQISEADVRSFYGLEPLESFRIQLYGVPRSRHRYRLFMLRVLVARTFWSTQCLLTREPRLILLARLLTPWRTVIFESHDLSDISHRKVTRRTQRAHRLALRVAHGVITVTTGGVAALESVGVARRRISLLPDAAAPTIHSVLQDGLPEDATVGYVGSLYADRGPDILIKALTFLSPSVKVVLIGGPIESAAALQRLAVELGVASRVEIRPPIRHAEVPAALASFDILALPMRGGLVGEVYASPVKLFEYMAAARPTVVVDLPTIREVVDEACVFFFEVDNAESLARAIEAVLREPDDALRRAARALERLTTAYTYELRVTALDRFARGVR